MITDSLYNEETTEGHLFKITAGCLQSAVSKHVDEKCGRKRCRDEEKDDSRTWESITRSGGADALKATMYRRLR